MSDTIVLAGETLGPFGAIAGLDTVLSCQENSKSAARTNTKFFAPPASFVSSLPKAFEASQTDSFQPSNFDSAGFLRAPQR
jgi:hypothetical protein